MKLTISGKTHDISNDEFLEDIVRLNGVYDEHGMLNDSITITSLALMDLMNVNDIIKNNLLNVSGTSFNVKLMLLFMVANDDNFKELSKISHVVAMIIAFWKKGILNADFFDTWNLQDLTITVDWDS